jgi:DedD protein
MDIALKQRLVGATVLVALGVIFIPMLLDGPGSGGAGQETIRISTSPDHRFESRLLPVEPQQTATGSDSPVAVESTERVPETGEPISPGPAIDRVTQPAKQVTSAAVAAPPSTKQVSPAGSLGSNADSSSAKTWVLQLGSFGNAANAARLVESLQQQSLGGYQEKVAVGGASMYRVRIGHWPSKDQAAAAGERVSAKFPTLDISVRQVDAVAGAPPPVAAPGTGWMVQVGSFSQQQNALVLRDKLRAGGFAAAIEMTAEGAHKVLVGPVLNRAAAESTRDQLKQKFEINGIVLSHP